MQGTIAVTDYDWYERLRQGSELDEVNFWKPSATQGFHAPEFSPFFFKLPSPHNAIGGFGFFASYVRRPDWYAWQYFGPGNGCESLEELQSSIRARRLHMRFRGDLATPEIGCVLIVQPTFFPTDLWVRAPHDWSPRIQGRKKYDLAVGEGARIWEECRIVARIVRAGRPGVRPIVAAPPGPRYGAPVEFAPRLGQGTFRAAVEEAYGRACAVTGEHSLPALEAAHIRPYSEDGPHLVSNGILMRVDFHRLFEKGYLSITENSRLIVSSRLRADFANGRSYYPYEGKPVYLPGTPANRPAHEYLAWHRETRFLG